MEVWTVNNPPPAGTDDDAVRCLVAIGLNTPWRQRLLHLGHHRRGHLMLSRNAGLTTVLPQAAGFSAASSLASKCNSALRMAACRVGALLCAPKRSVT
jgi:hypothetical protein